MASHSLPSVGAHGGLTRYLEEIRQFPMLEPQEEYMLAKSWREHGDRDAAHRLVTSHLRLVARIAMGYRGYGLPIGEVVSEGNVGLMQAVKRFDPDKGFRLATYAMWWIRAAIQEYILRSWSLVKMGTTAAQKKLFFNLRKIKGQLKALDEGDLRPDQVKRIATQLGVTEEDVVSMNRRLAGNSSLNAPVRNDSESGEWQDWLVDDTMDQETALAESEEAERRRGMLNTALKSLNDRERRVFEARRLAEDPLTLEELSTEFGVSRERIRQIEVRAFEKVQKAVQKAAAAAENSASRDRELMPVQNVVIIIEAGRRLSDYASVTVPTLLIVGAKTSHSCPRRVRHAECDAAELRSDRPERREPYEPVYPSFRGEPANRRPSRRSAPIKAVSSPGS